MLYLTLLFGSFILTMLIPLVFCSRKASQAPVVSSHAEREVTEQDEVHDDETTDSEEPEEEAEEMD